MHNLFLQPVLDQINLLMGRFYILPFIHVYKEHNMQEDRLSKQNLKLLKKSWCWWKMEGMGIIIKGLFSQQTGFDPLTSPFSSQGNLKMQSQFVQRLQVLSSSLCPVKGCTSSTTACPLFLWLQAFLSVLHSTLKESKCFTSPVPIHLFLHWENTDGRSRNQRYGSSS